MNKISVMSYNIWFDTFKREKRLISLVNTIKYNNPDIICLQEVVPEVCDILYDQLKNLYKFRYPKKIDSLYGCMIFSRYKIIQCDEHIYDKTQMERKLYYIVIEINNSIENNLQNLAIVTSHFESDFKKNNPIKISQYTEALNILNDLYNKYNGVILCADTNILPHEEKYFITKDKYWLDAWKESGSDKLCEYTYDTKLNINLSNRIFHNEIRSRIDRIIYRGQSILNPMNFKLIVGQEQTIEPSDHFGIMVDFEIVNNVIEI